jgi:hypothetical protein
MSNTKLALALQTPEAIALANEGAQVQQACVHILAMPIPDQKAYDDLGRGLLTTKARLSELEQGRRSKTDPLLEDVEVIREQYRPVEGAYKALDGAIRERMGRHVTETAAARVEAQRAAGEAFQTGDNAGAYAALVAAPMSAETDGIGSSEVWTFEIIAPELVPREYCEPVPKLVRATFKPSQRDAPAPIPGVKFTKKPKIVARG